MEKRTHTFTRLLPNFYDVPDNAKNLMVQNALQEMSNMIKTELPFLPSGEMYIAHYTLLVPPKRAKVAASLLADVYKVAAHGPDYLVELYSEPLFREELH